MRNDEARRPRPAFSKAALATLALLLGPYAEPAPAAEPLKVSAVVTEYRHNSHADVIVSRLLLTDWLDGKGPVRPLNLVSLYVDQRPGNDISRLLAASHKFPIRPSIDGALTLGTGRLAADAILIVAEHGDYPYSTTGNHIYPKRRFWDETVAAIRKSGKPVPVFIDKHLADNWADARHIYDEARELKIPLMAGSSVPGSWRHPAADVERGAPLKEIVGTTYGSTDAYGFHALEAVQSLAEQRKGGETGVKSVQMLTGDAVWKAIDEGGVDRDLFAASLRRAPGHEKGQAVDRKAVRRPKLYLVNYRDGLRIALFELNHAVGAWTAAWRDPKDAVVSTQFWTQEARPAGHFGLLLDGIQAMFQTGKPSWPVERTLLTSGVLDALMLSETKGGVVIETPDLDVAYQPTWRWKQPPTPPPARPWSEQ